MYGGFHAEVMRRRREWFTHLREAYTLLWWVPAGVRPTVADAELRLAALRGSGPTPYAFSVKRPFPAPGSVVEQPSDDDWFCRA